MLIATLLDASTLKPSEYLCGGRFMLAYGFVLFAVAMRVLAGTGVFSNMGFVPEGASLVFFGARMPRKQLWAPVALFIATDIYLTLGPYHQSRIQWDQLLIWAWYAGICLCGILLKDHVKPPTVLAAGLGSGVSFFLISNFGVWASGLVGYPKTWAGLLDCYVKAIPFFKRGIAADVLFTAAFFSIPVLVTLASRASQSKQAAA
jgi:hypothetical protein